ncbi:MAG TPA: hypothetical protein VJU78_07915 [Chitinophagaceae bacterium]|nr:hypothetical protein [Chitinophagaceae bacterium]
MKYFYLSLMMMFTSLFCMAKERSAEVAININEDEKTSFFDNPWVWVGTVIFIYLFLAVTRGGELKSPKP